MKGERNTRLPEAGAETRAATIDLSVYQVLVAGSLARPSKELAALAQLGVTVRAVLHAPDALSPALQRLALGELVLAQTDATLGVEAFRRASAAHLVVLVGDKADDLEKMLLPLLQDCMVGSMNDLLPMVRLDDPALRYLRTGKRWGYYLVGRALGLPPETARAYMEDCCGYENQNQERE